MKIRVQDLRAMRIKVLTLVAEILASTATPTMPIASTPERRGGSLPLRVGSRPLGS